jgi:hypothetical protein
MLRDRLDIRHFIGLLGAFAAVGSAQQTLQHVLFQPAAADQGPSTTCIYDS